MCCIMSHSCPQLDAVLYSFDEPPMQSDESRTMSVRVYMQMTACSPCFASSTESFSVVDLQGNEGTITGSLQAATGCCVQDL